MMRSISMPIGASPRAEKRRDRDIAGITLLLFGGLNLNGALLLLFDMPALLSPLVLCSVLLLWLRYALPSVMKAQAFVLFVASLGSYLAFAALFAATNPDFDTYYIKFYSATLLLVAGVYFWLTRCTDTELVNVLRTLKSILLVSCVFVPLSPYLSSYFAYSHSLDRPSGLFGNPNEAGVAALFCIVLIVAYPARSRLATFAQAAVALLALILSFSKAGMLTLVVLAALFVIGRRSVGLLCVAVLAFTLTALCMKYILENDVFQLSYDQRERLGDVLNILGGEISARTTTGRTLVWELGLRRIGQQLPWGAGLGEFHALVGGFRERPELDKWLGVHNTFLVILGEAGLFPLLLLIGFLTRLFIMGSRSPERMVAIGFGVIMVVDMLSSHNSFASRLSNIALASSMAIATRAAMKATTRLPFGLPPTAGRRLPARTRRTMVDSGIKLSPRLREGSR
jgi:O-antigen ligase